MNWIFCFKMNLVNVENIISNLEIGPYGVIWIAQHFLNGRKDNRIFFMNFIISLALHYCNLYLTASYLLLCFDKHLCVTNKFKKRPWKFTYMCQWFEWKHNFDYVQRKYTFFGLLTFKVIFARDVRTSCASGVQRSNSNTSWTKTRRPNCIREKKNAIIIRLIERRLTNASSHHLW